MRKLCKAHFLRSETASLLHQISNDGKLYFSVDRSNGGGSSGANRQLTRAEKFATLEMKQE